MTLADRGDRWRIFSATSRSSRGSRQVHRSKASADRATQLQRPPRRSNRLGLELRYGIAGAVIRRGEQRPWSQAPAVSRRVPHLEIGVEESSLAQSTGMPSTTASASLINGRRQRASFIFKASRITARRTATRRGVWTGLAEHDRHLVVAALQLDPGDDSFLVAQFPMRLRIVRWFPGRSPLRGRRQWARTSSASLRAANVVATQAQT